MTNILHLLLTTTLIFSNLGLNSQIQGQSPWFQYGSISAGTVPLRLGGTNVVTDESGAQVEYVEYEPFGSVKQDVGRKNIAKKFTGKELDSSTGLYDYDARQYDARIGRFISADTVDPNWANPQSLNRYSYTLNNPLKYVDPSGNVPLDYMTDPFFLAMSWAEFEANPTFWSGVGLTADAILTAIPYAPALGGGIIRGVSNALTKADDAARAAKVVDKAGDVGKAVDKSSDVIRVRHNTTLKGQKLIEKEGVIKTSKDGYAYVEKAKPKIQGGIVKGNPAEKARELGLGRKWQKGNAGIDFDVRVDELSKTANPVTGKPDLVIKGDVDLKNRNPKYYRRKP